MTKEYYDDLVQTRVFERRTVKDRNTSVFAHLFPSSATGGRIIDALTGVPYKGCYVCTKEELNFYVVITSDPREKTPDKKPNPKNAVKYFFNSPQEYINATGNFPSERGEAQHYENKKEYARMYRK
jgi:hypothetical protein